MKKIGTTAMLQSYHVFDREFWLSYKALEATCSPEIFDKIKLNLMRCKKVDPKYISDLEAYNAKKAEIDLEWKQKNEEAKQAGTQVHEFLEKLIVSDPEDCLHTFQIPTDKYKLEKAEMFQENDGIFTEYRMEVPINEEYVIIGIPDVIIKENNHIKLIDYKAVEKIDTSARFDLSSKKKKTMAYPLNGIPDCNFYLYSLQLSVYAWMLQKINPEFIIDSLEIYHIKNGKIKKTYPVEYMKNTVETLVKWHVKHIKLQEETNRCKEIKYM